MPLSFETPAPVSTTGRALRRSTAATSAMSDSGIVGPGWLSVTVVYSSCPDSVPTRVIRQIGRAARVMVK
jgi:hypothetical protein